MVHVSSFTSLSSSYSTMSSSTCSSSLIVNNSDTSIEDYVGTSIPKPSTDSTELHFHEGPESVILALLPVLETGVGEQIQLPGCKTKVIKHDKFRFFATQNPMTYIGRR